MKIDGRAAEVDLIGVSAGSNASTGPDL